MFNNVESEEENKRCCLKGKITEDRVEKFGGEGILEKKERERESDPKRNTAGLVLTSPSKYIYIYVLNIFLIHTWPFTIYIYRKQRERMNT